MSATQRCRCERFPAQYTRRYVDLDPPTTRTATAPPQPTMEAAMARERERQRRKMEAQMFR